MLHWFWCCCCHWCWCCCCYSVCCDWVSLVSVICRSAKEFRFTIFLVFPSSAFSRFFYLRGQKIFSEIKSAISEIASPLLPASSRFLSLFLSFCLFRCLASLFISFFLFRFCVSYFFYLSVYPFSLVPFSQFASFKFLSSYVSLIVKWRFLLFFFNQSFL